MEVENLTRVFGDKVAVDDLTFTVASGTVTGLLGPNGREPAQLALALDELRRLPRPYDAAR